MNSECLGLRRAVPVLLLAGLLAACGGGGGGSDGGDGGGGVSRDIDLSGAQGDYPLDSTDDVAKLAYALTAGVQVLVSAADVAGAKSSSYKAAETESCSGGGQVSYDRDETLPEVGVEVVFDECQEENVYSDGRVELTCNVQSVDGDCDPFYLEFGQGEVALMFEVSGNEGGGRALIFGFANGSAELDVANETFESLSLNLLLEAAFEPLDGGERTAVGFTNYGIDVESVEGGFTVDQFGTFLVDGGCGSGTVEVETDVDLFADTDSGDITAGVLTFSNDRNDSATATFNEDGSVTVVDDDNEEQTYTEEDLIGLCDLAGS